MPSHLHCSHFARVKAITNQHDQRVPDSTEHSHRLRVRHPQQAVVVHLENSHANLQSPVPCRCAGRTYLQKTVKNVSMFTFLMLIITSIKVESCQDVLLWIAKEPLRWRCPHLWGRKDFQHDPWPLRECWYQVSLQAASGSWFPAFPAVKGPAVPTYGSPACWPARPAQLPGVWHVAGQCCSPLISGRQHGAHIDLPTHEESPEEMRWSHGVMQQEMSVTFRRWKCKNTPVLQ